MVRSAEMLSGGTGNVFSDFISSTNSFFVGFCDFENKLVKKARMLRSSFFCFSNLVNSFDCTTDFLLNDLVIFATPCDFCKALFAANLFSILKLSLNDAFLRPFLISIIRCFKSLQNAYKNIYIIDTFQFIFQHTGYMALPVMSLDVKSIYVFA